MKNFKREMLRTIRNEPTERIPWIPRLDLWYQANRLAGTLPPEFRGATLREIVGALGAGWHSVVPDFKGDPNPEAEIDRALGLFNLASMPYRTVLQGVERRVSRTKLACSG